MIGFADPVRGNAQYQKRIGSAQHQRGPEEEIPSLHGLTDRADSLCALRAQRADHARRPQHRRPHLLLPSVRYQYIDSI